MDIEGWLKIAALCASGAVTPGPSLAVVVRGTVRGGRSRGVATALGHGLGVGLYALGAVAGFSAVVVSVPGLSRGLAVAGAVFLAYLGVRSLQAAGQGGGHADPGGDGGGFGEGFLTAFLNPKIAVFFLALLGSFVPREAGLATRTGVAGVALVVDATWYVFAAVVLVSTGGDRWLSSRAVLVERVTGVVLLVAAALALRA